MLAGDKSMPEMHLKKRGFSYNACGQFIKKKKKKKEWKKEKKKETRDIFIKTNQIRFVFNIIWLMEILKN